MYYSNRQWFVDDFGVIPIEKRYVYDVHWTRLNPTEFEHIAYKYWVDFDLWADAFEHAVEIHKVEMIIGPYEWEDFKNNVRRIKQHFERKRAA